MKLGTTNFNISKTRTKELWTNLFGTWQKISDEHTYHVVDRVYYTFRSSNYSDEFKLNYLSRAMQHLHITTSETTTTVNEADALSIENSIQKLMNFFSEFSFEPNFRFVNTFAYTCQENKAAATNYITRYFELTDSQFTESIVEKMQSAEFNEIYSNFSKYLPTKRINNRLKLYYGSAGTGKTTTAMQEAENNCVTCHSAMLPGDLMEDFKFNDGKAEFVPSALQNAMTEGKKIVLDEINLLPFESLRFLQTVLDGKTEFIYKGKTIKINDGFKIIGTMNLTVNGSVYSLPEPLVDRAEELKQYKLTAKNLVNAII